MREAISSSVRMSIVVPVYNKSNCIETCIGSLDAQSAPKDSFEVILVDDGSVDDSLAKCNALAETRPYLKVIAQENQGVSGARNTGIANASGDYIMFLDSDDEITENAVESIVSLFDSLGDATDVVSYRMLYRFVESGKETRHLREKWLKKTGLYHLAEVPYIAQSTMNICVRNRGPENILFSTDLRMGEDQLFVTENLKGKATIGYCNEAEYIYYRNPSSESARGNYPLYSYDDMIMLFTRLQEIGAENPFMRRYTQCLILYNVDWRLKGGMLFPTHLEGKEREEAEARLGAVLSVIPHDEYSKNPYLDGYRKAFLMDRFVFPGVKTQVAYTDMHSYVAFGDEAIWPTANPTVIFERCLFYDGQLRIRARIVCPSMRFENKPSLELHVGDAVQPLELKVSSYCYTVGRRALTKAWSFECAIDVGKLTGDSSIDFKLAIDGKTLPSLRLIFNPEVHNARIENEMAHFPGLDLDVRKIPLVAKPPVQKPAAPQKRSLFKKQQVVEEVLPPFKRKLVDFCKQTAGQRIWTYVDLPTSQAKGNALIALLHDLQVDDGIMRYFISDFEEELVATYPELEGRVVASGTDMHKILSFRSEIVICSYLERLTYSPFDKEEYAKYGDFTVKQRRVYVQHGILHARIPWYFSYDRMLIDGEVISTTMERDSLANTYGFPEKAIIESGAPRLDAIEYGAVRQTKKILYAPSWRSYLVAGNVEHREALDSAFVTSALYRGLDAFIEKLKISCLLEKTGYSLELKMHPNFKCYEHLFSFDCEEVSLAPDVIDEQDYPIVITDFSSYVYDFIYGGSDIVYFLPDHVEFKAGINHYRELEVPLDQAYGPYCETADQLFEAVKALIEGTADTSVYRQRTKDLFLHTDGKNCDRLYADVKAKADGLH